MAEVRYVESIDIDAPCEAVYAYRLDFSNLSEQNPHASDVRRIDGATEPGVGATYAFVIDVSGMGRIPATLRVVEARPPELIVDEIDAGILARERNTFEPSDGGTRLAIDVTVVTPDAYPLDEAGRRFIEDSGRSQVRLELETIKKVLER